jgi:phage gpG-like protein
MSFMKLTGAWGKVASILNKGASAAAWKLSSKKAVEKEANRVAKEVKKSFDRGGPPGVKWKPLRPMTLKIYEALGITSHGPLNRSGKLKNSVTVKNTGKASIIGFGSMSKIAAIHEKGAGPYAVPVTEKMRRFFKFLSARTNGEIKPLSSGKGVLIIKIPARPILKPLLKSQKKTVFRNIVTNTLKDMGLKG